MENSRVKTNTKLTEFGTGQIAYQVNLYFGRNHQPEISEKEVAAVGRKYVRLKSGIRFEENPNIETGLEISRDDGSYIFLFPSETAATEFLEKNDLYRWLKQTVSNSKLSSFTLDQLRQAKCILTKK